MVVLIFIVLLIGIFVFAKLRDRKDSTDTMFPPQGKEYTKRLETYMKTTRSALLLYDQSNHSPEIAMLTLEAMRRNLIDVAQIMMQPTEEERDTAIATLIKLGYHKGA